MSDTPQPPDPPEPDQPESNPPSGEGPQSQQIRTQHVSARVPERVSRGVFSTGVIMMTGATEFVVDFIQNLGPPASVVARVVVPHGVMPQFVSALKTNLDLYTQRFGAPNALPRPEQTQKQQSVQEIYDELKLPDENLSGSYSNGLMIGHTASEFKLDFLTNLFPHSAVSCRVFMSAPQVVRMLETWNHTLQQFQTRLQQQREREQKDRKPDPPPTD